MYYGIILALSALIMAPLFVVSSPNVNVVVAFSDGMYEPGLVSQLGGKIIGESKSLGMVHATIPLSQYARLMAETSVEFLELDREVSIVSSDSLESAEYHESWGIEVIGAEVVHSSEFTGTGIKVAVLDTGIDYRHPELVSNYNGGYDFVNDDDDPMDDNGHGTHVAGIIAAARDGNGVLGVAPEAEIYAVKVSDSRGKGSFSGLVKGIDWAIEHDIDIVTMSITGTGGTRALQKAVNLAYDDYGMLLVAAVGNGGSGDVLYPAAYDEVIGVGSVTSDNEKSSFSRSGDEVELVAPGSGIKSAAIGGSYRVSSGTSMATPFVTGALALILQSNEQAWSDMDIVNGDGEWINDEVRGVLRETAIDLGEEGTDEDFGYGLLNLQFPEEIARPEANPDTIDEADVINSAIDTDELWLKFVLALG
jgi:subtilisin family serine protease